MKMLLCCIRRELDGGLLESAECGKYGAWKM